MPKQLSKKDIKEVFIETLEPFAKAVQNDFNKVNRRFDGVESRLDGVESRLDGVESRLDGVESRLGKVESELKEVKGEVKEMKENSSALFAKLDDLISLYKKHDQELTVLSAQVRHLEERIDKLEAGKIARSSK